MASQTKVLMFLPCKVSDCMKSWHALLTSPSHLFLTLSHESLVQVNVKMIPSLLFPAFATLAAAVTLPLSESELGPGSLKPRSLGPRNLFNRESTFTCSSGYTCYDTQSCCGIGCCDSGYTCSSTFTCDPDTSTVVSSLQLVPCPFQEIFC